MICTKIKLPHSWALMFQSLSMQEWQTMFRVRSRHACFRLHQRLTNVYIQHWLWLLGELCTIIDSYAVHFIFHFIFYFTYIFHFSFYFILHFMSEGGTLTPKKHNVQVFCCAAAVSRRMTLMKQMCRGQQLWMAQLLMFVSCSHVMSPVVLCGCTTFPPVRLPPGCLFLNMKTY